MGDGSRHNRKPLENRNLERQREHIEKKLSSLNIFDKSPQIKTEAEKLDEAKKSSWSRKIYT